MHSGKKEEGDLREGGEMEGGGREREELKTALREDCTGVRQRNKENVYFGILFSSLVELEVQCTIHCTTEPPSLVEITRIEQALRDY